MPFAPCDMRVESPAFDNHGRIPRKHTQDGEDVSPPLQWSNAPEGSESFAVLCHDPDAPLCKPGSYGYVHWVAYNIAGSRTRLDEGASDGFTSGRTDSDTERYSGPAPPEGHGTHHYYFWVLALDRKLELEPGLTMSELLERVEPHVVGMNRMVGTYRRE